jgi:prepilin-type processing-associated H-X9-DG protein
MGQGAAVAGHSLKSCTREVLPFRYRHPGGGESNIVFVDTPGFDDTEIKDADILASIAQWLKQT